MRKLNDEEMKKCMEEWKKPLPKHTKYNYDECCMKQRLEYLFPDVFMDLELCDRPDLQSKDGEIGIEVTSTIRNEQQQIIQLATDIVYDRARSKEKSKELIASKGGKFTDYGLFGPQFDNEKNYDSVLQSIKNKLELLNQGGYKQFQKYHLAIESELFIEDMNHKNTPFAVMLYIKENIYRNYHSVFQSIYLFNPFTLYLLDFEKNTAQVISLDTHEMTRCSCEARIMAESNEVIP